MPYTGGSSTYFSYETRPVTITVLDLRTYEEIFTINVPPGKQLTFDFKEGESHRVPSHRWILGPSTIHSPHGRLVDRSSVPPYARLNLSRGS